MTSKWERVPVSEACELIVDCVNKTAPTVDYETSYKMIRTTNIRNGRLDLSTTKFVTEDTYIKWTRRATVEPDDVLLTREAPLGEVGRVREKDTIFLGQRIMQYRADKKVLDPRFLFYSFCSKELQNQFHAHGGSGSVVDHIRVGDCHKFLIPLPPLDEQKAIAHILGTLDDKIELNQQMNHTLESIARALFKSWFIDFDPVRAKMDGRQPTGMDAETAALFPDEFEDSALGEIPTGWNVVTLGDVVHIKHGYAFKSEFFVDPERGVPIVVNIGNFKYEGGFRFENTTLKGYAGEYPPEFILLPGEILLVMTCQTAGGEILGIPGRIPVDERKYLHNQRMGKVVIADSNRINDAFLYQLLLRPEFNQELFSTASGTKILHTSPNRIEAFRFCLPPEALQRKAKNILEKLENKAMLNDAENKALSSIRNALLPKLLSGEIRVKDAEKFVEAVT